MDEQKKALEKERPPFDRHPERLLAQITDMVHLKRSAVQLPEPLAQTTCVTQMRSSERRAGPVNRPCLSDWHSPVATRYCMHCVPGDSYVIL